MESEKSSVSIVLASLEYLRMHSHELFSDNIILLNEIKRVIDSNDTYFMRSMRMIIRQECERKTAEYYRKYMKYSENENRFDFDIQTNKLIKSFWDNFEEIFDTVIPREINVQPRRSH